LIIDTPITPEGKISGDPFKSFIRDYLRFIRKILEGRGMSKEFLLEQMKDCDSKTYDSLGCAVSLIKGSSEYNLLQSLTILNKCLLDSNFFNDVIVKHYFDRIKKIEGDF